MEKYIRYGFIRPSEAFPRRFIEFYILMNRSQWTNLQNINWIHGVCSHMFLPFNIATTKPFLLSSKQGVSIFFSQKHFPFSPKVFSGKMFVCPVFFHFLLAFEGVFSSWLLHMKATTSHSCLQQ